MTRGDGDEELRPPLATCAARAARRTDGAIADYAAYTDFYAAFDAEDRFVIRNEAQEPADVAAEIRAGLADGRFRLDGMFPGLEFMVYATQPGHRTTAADFGKVTLKAGEVRALGGCRVVVVENGSPDDSAARIAAAIRAENWDWAELLPLAENRGFAGGNNAALRPPVIFCGDGEARLAVRRETYADLTAREIGFALPAG